MVVASVLAHGEAGTWDEALVLILSALIGLALAHILRPRRKNR